MQGGKRDPPQLPSLSPSSLRNLQRPQTLLHICKRYRRISHTSSLLLSPNPDEENDSSGKRRELHMLTADQSAREVRIGDVGSGTGGVGADCEGGDTKVGDGTAGFGQEWSMNEDLRVREVSLQAL